MKNNIIYSIIPARGGSKGVPGKNIKLLNDQPLIAYSIKASTQCKYISRTIVSTDSEEISSISRQFGAEIPFIRPSEISKDSSTDLEFVIHALNWFKQFDNTVPDYIVHLRPTTPLRDIEIVNKSIEMYLSQEGFTALRSVHEMSESAYKTFEIDNNTLKTVFTKFSQLDASNNVRQSFPKTYSANGYVDILDCKYIMKNNRIHGDNVMSYITPVVTEVDTYDDFDLLEYEINKKQNIYQKLFEVI